MTDKKRNVLILLADQQRYDTIHAAGYPHMITPNLDRLAGEGVLFTQCHSTNPVCMACRHDLITGRPGRDHGYYTNLEHKPIDRHDTPTLPRIFSENGYRTAAVGKMHFYPAREHHGFGEMYLMEELPKKRQDDQYLTDLAAAGRGDIQNPHGVRPLLYHQPQRSQQSAEEHGTMWVADRAVQWIADNGDQPFLLMCGFIQPHPPWNIPEEWKQLYQNVSIPEPTAASRMPMDGSDRNPWFGDYDTREEKEAVRKAYFTAISMVDAAVGRIVDYLRSTEQLENTLVIYTSDHGEMLQDKGYYSKELPYDGAVRVPLIVRFPNGDFAGMRRADFVDSFDIFPTCLDICGLESRYPADGGVTGSADRTGNEATVCWNGGLMGRSLVKENTSCRNLQCSSSGLGDRRFVMCRDERYKYIYHYNGGYEELYDMSVDPGEQKNLFEDVSGSCTGYTDIIRRLKTIAIKYESSCGPEGYVKDGAFCPLGYRPYHGSIRGKYHFWANYQMQDFYEGIRDGGLLREIKYALQTDDSGTDGISGMLRHELWQHDFEEQFMKYTGRELTAEEKTWLFGRQ